MKPFSSRFKWFVLVAVCLIVLGRLLIHYGPNDSGAGNFTYQTVGKKYGFPLPSVYVGSPNPPAIRLYWHIVSYQKDATGDGGTYIVAFTHSEQDGPSIKKFEGQLECHYDAMQKNFSLLDLQATPVD